MLAVMGETVTATEEGPGLGVGTVRVDVLQARRIADKANGNKSLRENMVAIFSSLHRIRTTGRWSRKRAGGIDGPNTVLTYC